MDASDLTVEQRAALLAAGSYVEASPPRERRASSLAKKRLDELCVTALRRPEVEDLLATGNPLDERVKDRTLLAVDVDGEQRYPVFQFHNGAELPHWREICSVFPENAPIVSIAYFMTAPSVDLEICGASVSPVQWLLAGRPSEEVTRLADHAFEIRL